MVIDEIARVSARETFSHLVIQYFAKCFRIVESSFAHFFRFIVKLSCADITLRHVLYIGEVNRNLQNEISRLFLRN